MNGRKEKILDDVRAHMPWRAIGFGEAKLIAERQANLLLKRLKVRQVPVDVFRITEQLGMHVEVRPRYLMADVAGCSKSKGSTQLILVNQGGTLGRRRFVLGHEIKHLLDDQLDRYVYAQLGLGDPEVHDRLVEKVCDHFAACLLMPKAVLRRAWSSGIQEPEVLADLFDVSTSSMILHLRYWGFTKIPPQSARYYFSRVSPAPDAVSWLDRQLAIRASDADRLTAGDPV